MGRREKRQTPAPPPMGCKQVILLFHERCEILSPQRRCDLKFSAAAGGW